VQAKRGREQGPSQVIVQDGAGSRSSSKAGKGSIPPHYLEDVPVAVEQPAYKILKRSVQERLGQGGETAELDALQIAATGVYLAPGGLPSKHTWVTT